MEQSDINKWVEKQVEKENISAQIVTITHDIEVQKRALADQIAALDYQKEAEIQALKSQI